MLRQYHESRQALGGNTTIVVTAEHEFSGSDFAELWRKVYQFERQFSRFLPESELSQFNRRAGLDTPISQEFATLLQSAQQLSQRTNGLYNPFILPAVQRTGYVQSALDGYEDDVAPDYRMRSSSEANRLQVKANIATIPYGTAIDMGGCGKGYLADMLAKELRALSLPGFWVSLSGDMATYGIDANEQPWQTGVQDAQAKHAIPYIISATGRQLGIATSGTLRRKNQHLKAGAHHIIDPRSGQPADTDIRLATVVTHRAIDADVFASCAVIVGSEQAPALLRELGVLGFVLQTADRLIVEGDVLLQKSLSSRGVSA